MAVNLAGSFEFFEKLGDFGRSLDKISSVSNFYSNAEGTNKSRACLKLKALLNEAKSFKAETSKTIADARSRQNLEDILEICKEQALEISEKISEVEDHLTKYGYQRPTEKLPGVCEELSDSSDAYDESDVCPCDSDKENQLPAKEKEQTAEESVTENNLVGFKALPRAEIDPLATPVRPTTFTKLIQNYDLPTKCPDEPRIVDDPRKPHTTTPLLKPKCQNSDINSPASLESSMQPTTPVAINSLTPTFVATQNSPVEDFPTPPTFDTPGLKHYPTKGGSLAALNFECLDTPPPPNVEFVNRLNPGELCLASKQKIQLEPHLKTPSEFKETRISQKCYNLVAIEYKTYKELPMCIQNQFSFEQINHLITELNKYLNTRENVSNTTITDKELRSVLKLGVFTQAFILALLKLEYLILRKSGVYTILNNFVS